jgi:tRNA(adenine34) deaminase
MSKKNKTEHENFMRQALLEAKKAFEADEIPVGAVIVHNGKIIARAHNQTELLKDVTAHAEMLAITSASSTFGVKFLNDCTLYVTLEPCIMCAGAIFWSRVAEIVFGAYDPKRGFTNVSEKLLHPKTKFIGGVLAEECGSILTKYFEKKRK